MTPIRRWDITNREGLPMTRIWTMRMMTITRERRRQHCQTTTEYPTKIYFRSGYLWFFSLFCNFTLCLVSFVRMRNWIVDKQFFGWIIENDLVSIRLFGCCVFCVVVFMRIGSAEETDKRSESDEMTEWKCANGIENQHRYHFGVVGISFSPMKSVANVTVWKWSKVDA